MHHVLGEVARKRPHAALEESNASLPMRACWVGLLPEVVCGARACGEVDNVLFVAKVHQKERLHNPIFELDVHVHDVHCGNKHGVHAIIQATLGEHEGTVPDRTASQPVSIGL